MASGTYFHQNQASQRRTSEARPERCLVPQAFPLTNLTPTNNDQVFLITGANSGVGFELAKLLYQKNGTVYIAARSQSKIKAAIESIRQGFPSSTGRLESIVVDLSDLRTVGPAARDFLACENRLDVLFHNAGVMLTATGAESAQGHELRMATNCLGPQLLTDLLAPLLVQTARAQPSSQKDSVRIVWVSSMVNSTGPKAGIVWDEVVDKPKLLTGMDQYMQTKVGDVLLAHEWGERLAPDGIVSVVSLIGPYST